MQRRADRARSMRRTAIRSPGRSSTTSSPGWSGSRATRRRFMRAGVPVVLAGDYNVVPTDARYLSDQVLRQRCAAAAAKPRGVPAQLLEQGWIDAIRALHPDEPMYTFWDYMRNRWPRDAGLRLDHLLLSPQSSRRALSAPASIATCAARRARAITRRPGSSCAMRASARAHAGRAKPRNQRTRGRSRKPRKRDSMRGRCWSSTAIPSRIAPITRCRRPFCGAAASRPARSSASPIFCCASTARSSRAPCWSAGTRSRRRPTGTGSSRPIRAGANSTMRWSSSSTLLPEFVAACGFANAKAPGYEADDFLAAAVAAEEKRGGTRAGGERRPRHVPARLRAHDHPLSRCAPARWRASGRPRCASATASSPRRCRTSSRCAAIRPTSCRARRASAPQGAAALLRKYGTLEAMLEAGRFPAQAEAAAAVPLRSPPWTARRRCRRCAIRRRHGTRPPRSRANGGSSKLAERLEELA